MINIYKKDKIILNIDETWLSQTDFRKRKWKFPYTKNSVASAIIIPRIILKVLTLTMTLLSFHESSFKKDG